VLGGAYGMLEIFDIATAQTTIVTAAKPSINRLRLLISLAPAC
jgi:hypothetical protein